MITVSRLALGNLTKAFSNMATSITKFGTHKFAMGYPKQPAWVLADVLQYKSRTYRLFLHVHDDIMQAVRGELGDGRFSVQFIERGADQYQVVFVELNSGERVVAGWVEGFISRRILSILEELAVSGTY